MALPRAVATNIDRLAARLSFVTERLSRLERSAHRHEGGLALMPVGTILDYLGLDAPSSAFVIMQGQTLVNAQTNFPTLWNVIAPVFKSGNSIILPDTRGRVFVGQDLGDPDFEGIGNSGGAKDVSLTIQQLASHVHNSGSLAAALSGALSMSGSTTTGGEHTHLVRDYPSSPTPSGDITGGGFRGQRDNVLDGQVTRGSGAHSHNVSVSGASHGHSISGATESTGAGEPHNNLQPYVVTVKILKVL